MAHITDSINVTILALRSLPRTNRELPRKTTELGENRAKLIGEVAPALQPSSCSDST